MLGYFAFRAHPIDLTLSLLLLKPKSGYGLPIPTAELRENSHLIGSIDICPECCVEELPPNQTRRQVAYLANEVRRRKGGELIVAKLM